MFYNINRILRSTGTAFSLSTFALFTLDSKLSKSPGTVFNSSISNSYAYNFKQAKSTLISLQN